MSASTEEIFISLKRNGFDISLLEVEEILSKLVEEGFIQREMPSVLERTKMKSVLN
jgi:Fe2+ or Zn2+ uptake regulation protein